MGSKTLSTLYVLLILLNMLTKSWGSSGEESKDPQYLPNRGSHSHFKRYMLSEEPEIEKRRLIAQRIRNMKKKIRGPTKAAIIEDDIDYDEVAVGPAPVRPKYDRTQKKECQKHATTISIQNSTAVNLVRDVLSQLGREFMFRQVNEDFVFGQYVGNAMRNLTNDLRLKMQHEILELVVKYHKLNRVEVSSNTHDKYIQTQEGKPEKRSNDTDELWPDAINLEKIVG